jgi:ceramide glucosyltransferase
VTYLLLAVAAAAGVYQFLALLAAFRHFRSPEPAAAATPPVSILKPVRGLDPHFLDSIRSHALQDYPDYEILFGVADPGDPAAAGIRGLACEFPGLPIRLVESATPARNGKVGVLADLAAAARHPVLVIDDSDIQVPPDYLRRVAASLENPANGLVTCLYKAAAEGWPARIEAVGIATDFAPGVLVARMLGISEFGLGSTLALRAETLRKIGGFEAFSDYLADDYQLSRRVRDLGLRIALSKLVVETHLPRETWREMWLHQLRWARTIRVSRAGGYTGMPVMYAGLWALALALSGLWWAAGALLGLRMAAGAAMSAMVLGDQRAAQNFFLTPLRDLLGFAVWVGGLFGETVVWRGSRMRLSKDGRILEVLEV